MFANVIKDFVLICFISQCNYSPLGPRNRPPLTSRVCPVIHRASSEAKKATASAMSAGHPGRPSAVMPATRSTAFASLSRMEGFMSVSVIPGEIVFTVIFRDPNEFASDLHSTLRAPLVIEDAVAGVAKQVTDEEMLMI